MEQILMLRKSALMSPTQWMGAICFCLMGACLFLSFKADARFATFAAGGRNIHGEITRSAVNGLNISPQWLDRIVASNKEQDSNEVTHVPPITPNSHYEGRHHFDRNTIVVGASTTAFKAGAGYLKEQRAKTLTAINNSTPAEAADALGRATHALQDFFAHSNYIDLPVNDQEKLRKALGDPSLPIPASLRLTGYDRQTGKVIPGDDYSHEQFSKDGPPLIGPESPESKVLVGNKTKHEIARAAAVTATREFLKSVRADAGAKWVVLQD
jgi:hypothetical protein